MVCIPGRLGKLEVSDDDGATYKKVGAAVDITLNGEQDSLECTTHDSGGSREYIANQTSFTLDVSGRWEDGDPGQEAVVSAFFNHTSLLFKFVMEQVAGRKLFQGSMFPTSYSPNSPLDDTGMLDLAFQCSAVTRSTQV